MEAKTYKAEFADEEMEVFTADSDSQAVNEAYEMEKDHGILWDVYLLDENYNEIKMVF